MDNNINNSLVHILIFFLIGLITGIIIGIGYCAITRDYVNKNTIEHRQLVKYEQRTS